MVTSFASATATRSPLEDFVRDYVETTGGVWDEVEPQVYDVLLPSADSRPHGDAGEREILRITFDPEALPEHPGSQLASYGTPLIDRLLADALRRGPDCCPCWRRDKSARRGAVGPRMEHQCLYLQ